jgi:hypothetical protein
MGPGTIFTDAIAALAPHFLRCPHIVPDILNLVSQLPEKGGLGDNTRASVMSVLVPYLPTISQAATCEQLLEVAEHLEEMSPFRYATAAQLFAIVASHMPQRCMAKALNLARNMKDAWAKVATLVALLPGLVQSKSLLDKALSSIEDLPQDSGLGGSPYAEALGRVIPFLTSHSELLSRGKEAATAIKNEHQRFFVQLALIKVAPEDLRQQQASTSLPFAISMRDAGLRCRALATLCPLLPEQMRASVARDAFQDVFRISSREAQNNALDVVAPCLRYDPELLVPALRFSASITHIEQRPRIVLHILDGIAEQPSNEVLDLALDVALGTYDQDARDQILSVVTQLISGLSERQQLMSWRTIVRNIAAHPRPSRLADIGPLANIAASLGGATAIAALARSVIVARTWWP